MNNRGQQSRAHDERRLGHRTRAHRVLAVIWMAESCCVLAWMLVGLVKAVESPRGNLPPDTLPLISLVIAFALCGITGGAFLFKGSTWGRRTVRILALLTAGMSGWQMHVDYRLWLAGRLFREREMLIFGGIALFSLLTIALLHPARGRDFQPKPTAQAAT